MAKYALIASTPKMEAEAQKIVWETARRDVAIYMLPARETASAGRLAVESGAEIIIARGGIAAEVKRSTNLTVVEVVITAQEMGLLITEAKKRIAKPRPVIGVVGIESMFCDMSDFDKIFDIELKTRLKSSSAELESGVYQIAAEGVDLIIGGEAVCELSEKLGIPSMLQPDGSDSIRQALRLASNVAFAADLERKNASELNMLLNFSFNGIIKLNNDAEVVVLNQRAAQMLGISISGSIGRSIAALVPELDSSQIRREVLTAGQELFKTFTRESGSSFSVSIAPIKVQDNIEGAILSCLEIQSLVKADERVRRELYQGGADLDTFERIAPLYSENASFLRSARYYSQFDTCVLLSGGYSSERYSVAQCIHTASLRRSAPFIHLNISGLDVDSQLIRLFSPDGAITKAHGGTLFVDEVEYLTPQAQYRLLRLIDDGLLINGVSSEPAPVSVRVLAGSGASLRSPAADGSFRTDLYYALSAVSLELPSIDGCFNETERWAEYYIRMFCDQYSRNVNLTRTARTAISRYSWEGGLAELKSFCRRLVISSPKLIADENMVQQLLPNKLSSGSKSLYDAESGSEAARLSSLLEMYGGNRTIVAEKMGVSKTTLWRRLKKYGLQ